MAYHTDTLALRVRDFSALDGIVGALGGAVETRIPQLRQATVKIDPASASEAFIAYERHPQIEWVTFEDEGKAHALEAYHVGVPNLHADRYAGLKRMGVFQAWRYGRGGAIEVGVLDDGLDARASTWPEYSGRQLEMLYCVESDPYPPPTLRISHGTRLAGVIASQESATARAVGIAPDCTFATMRFIDNDGKVSATPARAGITTLVDLGYRIINMSYGFNPDATGTPESSAATNPLWVDLLNYASNAGALLFFSAGNEGQQQATVPASFAPLYGHFGVGCTDSARIDRPASYSNYGPYCNIVAPGHTYYTPTHYSAGGGAYNPISSNDPPSPFGSPLFNGSGANWAYTPFNGTSCAAPLSAGAAAVAWSVNPALSASQLRDIFLSTLDKPQDSIALMKFTRSGCGVPNAYRAAMKARTTLPGNAGAVFPFIFFYGDGAETRISDGAATTHLRGEVYADVSGFCSNAAVTRVQVWAGAECLYDGVPRTTWDTLLPLPAAKFAGARLRVVAFASNGAQGETEFTDIIGYAVSDTPPKTSASLVDGEYSTAERVTLTAVSDNVPVRIHYRWNNEPWQTYSGSLAIREGTLHFYGVDALGNVEGGIDYASQ